MAGKPIESQISNSYLLYKGSIILSSLEIQKSTMEENRDEMNYLAQIKEILEKGKERTDRTGVGTIAIFGMQARYDLRNSE